MEGLGWVSCVRNHFHPCASVDICFFWAGKAAKIRQQARDLLEHTPTTPPNTSSSNRAAMYESYHNDAGSSIGTVRIGNTGNTYQRSSAPDTTWRSSEYEVGESLSMTSVATMAFSCIAQCLTEGLRAASSYYGADSPYQSAGEQHVSSGVNKYQQVEEFDRKGSFRSDRLGETMERTPETREEWANVPVPSYQSG